jgi:hypothetical protein
VRPAELVEEIEDEAVVELLKGLHPSAGRPGMDEWIIYIFGIYMPQFL